MEFFFSELLLPHCIYVASDFELYENILYGTDVVYNYSVSVRYHLLECMLGKYVYSAPLQCRNRSVSFFYFLF